MPRTPKRWTAVRDEPLQDCRVFRVSRSFARSPHTGRVHPFYTIDAEAWVNVVPLTHEGDVVLVRQYRHGTRDLTLEIPGGLVDPGESPAEAAGRELLEETGYRAEELVPMGDLNPNPALFGNRVHTFVARGCRRVAEVANEGLEETAVELLRRDDLPAAVRRGDIDHALVVAAFYWLELVEDGGGAVRR